MKVKFSHYLGGEVFILFTLGASNSKATIENENDFFKSFESDPTTMALYQNSVNF